MQRKLFLRYVGATFGTIALTPVLTACGGGDALAVLPAEAAPSTAAAVTATATSLLPEEIAALKFMREEEKLAHDVYAALYSLWGANVFYQIALSETTHTEAILALLIKYCIDDPAADNAPGEFADPALQTLYNTLITMGQVNLIEGLKVGALIEETDIRDIHEKMAITDENDILKVYTSLLCGSGNHLRAFNKKLLEQGVTYVPQVITQEEWEAIASAPAETCGG
ncbi:DUF2202 domain-containing protein [Rhodoferax sp.]|uniref:DUF2202 domain-containing protein n=1 Tax=Rhodoferax sp. TaxID=50421 RepID=UPI00260AA600|nr:DUF2202 domain-containing protein [Rhodoferax sp.]MDD2918544.1 DUF2202 domain-containing protein [Rhodoferax sp.]